MNDNGKPEDKERLDAREGLERATSDGLGELDGLDGLDEAPPTAEELAAAAALAEASDRLLADPTASSESPDGEAAELLATAGLIHASTHDIALARARRDALLDEALRSVDQRRRARPLRRLAPLLALAAALLLALAAVLGGLGRGPFRRPAPRVAQELPRSMTSRPSNDLLGRPITDRAGASRRLDQVFASRMAGYRALRLRGFQSGGRSR